jgi:hypothetical protein
MTSSRSSLRRDPDRCLSSHRRHLKNAVPQGRPAPRTTLALTDVCLDPFGIRVVAAPLRYCRRIRWNEKAAVVREPGADWSEIAFALNAARAALVQRARDARSSAGHVAAPGSPMELDCSPWREDEVAVVCFRDGAPLDKLTRCSTCGEHFVQFSTWQGAVCSDKCRPTRPSRAKAPQAKECRVCGTAFATTRPTVVSCSMKCRVALRRSDEALPALRNRRR